MVEFGVAIAWIAISAASAKGLMAFGRAAAAGCAEEELSWQSAEGTFAHDGLLARVDAPARRLGRFS